MHWNLMNDDDFGSFKFQKLKYRRRDQIIQLFCRIGSTQEIRTPLLNLRKFQKPEKSTADSYRMHSNPMNDQIFGSFRFLKLKYRRGDQRILPFWRIASPKEIRPPLLNLRKFENLEKRTAESCRMHWNLMNDEEFGSFELLKLKYRRV